MPNHRVLYYIPMIHSPKELGSLGGKILNARRKLKGEKETNIFLRQINQYWQEVEKRIQNKGLLKKENAKKLHIFIDGLPDANESVIKLTVNELISRKLPVYCIIEKLQKAGAKIHGVENFDLLLQEYKYQTNLFNDAKPNPILERELLLKRDEAITKNINKKLPAWQIGILFIGHAHNIKEPLLKLTEPDFKIIDI